ncbi:flavodoxin family protein [Methanococcus maripaludis]|uniref:Flavodoxin n=1 Tax=Methanococcus maripaludis TaxID=39152 RepID=A0A7J9RZL8_METMI|nr:flavodoxin [Methanococcus maripaludis]MBB6067489.1 flavodoxin [Methanococcus maripaludis]
MDEKKLVIYYSLFENTEYVANLISENTGADLLKIETVTEIPKKGLAMFLELGRFLLFRKMPEIKEISVNLDEYDTIFIGTPVWAGNMAAPLKTFFSKYKFDGKKVAVFCTAGKTIGNTLENMKKELIDNELIGGTVFLDVLNHRAETENYVKEWLTTMYRSKED